MSDYRIFLPHPIPMCSECTKAEEKGGDKKSLDVVVVGTTKLSRGGKGEKEEEKRRRKVAMAKSVSLLLLLPAVIAQRRRRRRRNDSGEKVPTSKKGNLLALTLLSHICAREKENCFLSLLYGKDADGSIGKVEFPADLFLQLSLYFYPCLFETPVSQEKGELHP